MNEPGAIGGSRGYLDFIDGLRAISILAVVAFHIGLPAPSGGFFGVDIFFVISGFLIIGQIVADCEAGTFKFGRFWARRVLRILPSYLLVSLACAALSFFVLVTPAEFFDFSEEVMWSAGMAMNSWLIRHVGYFDPDANVKMLLHLWSLAVEEQFYIIAPIVIAVFFGLTGWFRRLLPRWLLLPAGLAIVFMWSLGLAMRDTSQLPSQLFYHTEHRIWEFVAGGGAAMLAPRLRLLPEWLLEGGTAFGAAAIAIAIFGFARAQSFPSAQTVVPVLGAALLLGFGAVRPTRMTRALSWRPLRGIGLVSYAWYLWHWPLMSFAYIAHFGDHDPVLRLVCAAVSFLLAVLTYLLLENPLRAHRRQLARAMPWRIVLVGLAACVGTMSVGWWMNTQYVAAVAANIPASMTAGRDEPDPDCALARVGSIDPCLARKGDRPAVFLLGDSHASVAAKSFQEIALDHRSWVISMAIDGCTPFLETHIVGPSDDNNGDCSAQQQAALQRLDGRNTGIRAAIIEAQWLFHTAGNRPIGAESDMDDHAGFVAAVQRTLDALESLGVKKTLILAPLPLFRIDPPACLLRADRTGASRDICSEPRSAADAQRATAMSWLQESVARRGDAMLADPIGAFCDSQWCRPYRHDTVYYADFSHLDHRGELELYTATRRAFDWLFAPD
jgi:peptidoglycan/LPS O-acetylase OafA/YrhL